MFGGSYSGLYGIPLVLYDLFKFVLVPKTAPTPGVGELLQSVFWTPGLPVGVHSNRPCLSVRPSVRLSVFKYRGDRSLFFSETLLEVRDH